MSFSQVRGPAVSRAASWSMTTTWVPVTPVDRLALPLGIPTPAWMTARMIEPAGGYPADHPAGTSTTLGLDPASAARNRDPRRRHPRRHRSW